MDIIPGNPRIAIIATIAMSAITEMRSGLLGMDVQNAFLSLRINTSNKEKMTNKLNTNVRICSISLKRPKNQPPSITRIADSITNNRPRRAEPRSSPFNFQLFGVCEYLALSVDKERVTKSVRNRNRTILETVRHTDRSIDIQR